MNSIVTGGAGFIGSHLVDALLSRGDNVIIIDSLVTGQISNIECDDDSIKTRIKFVNADLLSDDWTDCFVGVDCVYHLAADPDVRGSARKSFETYQNNVTTTVRVLEAMREHGVREIVFTSTSTVYGDALVIPTPENYSPLIPISIYGSTKLACESMIASYASTYGMKAWVYRFANIIGPRSTHGVIYDFIQKLKLDNSCLEILGDGMQSKSYLYVENCISAMLFAKNVSNETFNVFNIGSSDWISVKKIAELVALEMGLVDVSFKFTGGSRGWVGDVSMMLLSVDLLKSLGWESGIGSEESVIKAIKSTLIELI